MPGIISGLGSAVVAAMARYNDYHGADRLGFSNIDFST
jgi:hypothetical protein